METIDDVASSVQGVFRERVGVLEKLLKDSLIHKEIRAQVLDGFGNTHFLSALDARSRDFFAGLRLRNLAFDEARDVDIVLDPRILGRVLVVPRLPFESLVTVFLDTKGRALLALTPSPLAHHLRVVWSVLLSRGFLIDGERLVSLRQFDASDNLAPAFTFLRSDRLSHEREETDTAWVEFVHLGIEGSEDGFVVEGREPGVDGLLFEFLFLSLCQVPDELDSVDQIKRIDGHWKLPFDLIVKVPVLSRISDCHKRGTEPYFVTVYYSIKKLKSQYRNRA